MKRALADPQDRCRPRCVRFAPEPSGIEGCDALGCVECGRQVRLIIRGAAAAPRRKIEKGAEKRALRAARRSRR